MFLKWSFNINQRFIFLRINGALHLKSYWKSSFWTEKVPLNLSCMLHGGGFSRSDVSVLLESFRFVHIFEIQFFGRTRVQNRSWNFFSKYFLSKCEFFDPFLCPNSTSVQPHSSDVSFEIVSSKIMFQICLSHYIN